MQFFILPEGIDGNDEQETAAMICSVISHYDQLIDEGNDPVHDALSLQAYMNQ